MLKILLVEDDKNIQRLLTLELRHQKYIVDSAYCKTQNDLIKISI